MSKTITQKTKLVNYDTNYLISFVISILFKQNLNPPYGLIQQLYFRKRLVMYRSSFCIQQRSDLPLLPMIPSRPARRSRRGCDHRGQSQARAVRCYYQQVLSVTSQCLFQLQFVEVIPHRKPVEVVTHSFLRCQFFLTLNDYQLADSMYYLIQYYYIGLDNNVNIQA